MISVSVVNPLMLENGWTFEDGYKVTPDPVINARYLHQVYTAAQSDYSGRVTVPTLWDKKQGTIVSNESADIIRMFNSRSEEHTSELQSRGHLVCRLLLEKTNTQHHRHVH